MPQSPLTKDLISDPSRYRLCMLADSCGIDVVVYSPVEENSLIHRRIDFAPGSDTTTHAALEEAIYDNPLLLDFAHVDCLVDTRRYMLLPTHRAADATDMLTKLYGQAADSTLQPVEDEFEIISTSITEADAVLAMAVSRKLTGFLRRTFNNPRIWHRMIPLIRYYGHRTRFGNSGKIHVHLRKGESDIIAYDGGRLLMANTFTTPTPDDASFYALSAGADLGFDRDRDRMLLSGKQELREAVMLTLRRYASLVMPMIFPSEMFRMGKAAMKAPFELIALPLS